MSKKPEVSIIIVNHNTKQYLEKCLLSLTKQSEALMYEIIIVDNSNEESVFSFGSKRVCVYQTENHGFAAACNYGAHKAQGSYILFLNPDTELLTDNLQEVENILKRKDVGVVGCGLYTVDGGVQPWSVGCDLTLKEILLGKLGLGRSSKLWENIQRKEVDWVSGASLGISKRLFQSIKGFDEAFFMYYEDVDLCKRVRAQGRKILYCPTIRFTHISGGSFNPHSQQKKSFYYTSQDIFFAKHFGKVQGFIVKFLRKTFLYR